MKRSLYVTMLLLIIILIVINSSCKEKLPVYNDDDNIYHAGLRRSSYGQKIKKNNWWAYNAQAYTIKLENVSPIEPAIIQIIGKYNFDAGHCQMEFEKPEGYKGDTTNMVFKKRTINHEAALNEYDRKGISAIIQFESGNADIVSCIELAQYKFGHHKSIIGYGVDAEWYFHLESESKMGKIITDEEAERWMNKVLSINKDFTLFVKHWETDQLPETYRHPNFWFLNDSQEFQDINSMMDDFSIWGMFYSDSNVGYQFGYDGDMKWWSQYDDPVGELSQTILKEVPNTRYLFWVDFTAHMVIF